MDRLSFISVPDFRKEVEEEAKPSFFLKLTEGEQAEYTRNLVNQRALLWSCRTAASAYNLAIVLVLFFVAVNGIQIATFIRGFFNQ